MSSPNEKIEHITDIKGNIDEAWNALSDLSSWEWNKWTRLEPESLTTGAKCKMRASFKGDDEWVEYDCVLAEVNPKTYTLSWSGSVAGGCLFSGFHTMRLETVQIDDSEWVRLTHTETFGGILPVLWLGLDYNVLNENYLLMNRGFKSFIEKRNT